jgi:hypothetical protein
MIYVNYAKTCISNNISNYETPIMKKLENILEKKNCGYTVMETISNNLEDK